MITMLSLPVNVGELEVAGGQEQTHEIYWDEVTSTGFVSIVTSSRLLQVPLAPNAVLAERFNTLDKLREQPPLARFVEFASRQRQSACRCR